MKHFIKSQFYFNRRERNGIVVLVILIAAITSVMAFRNQTESLPIAKHENFFAMMNALEDSIAKMNIQQDRPEPVLFRFDPNQIDQKEFVALGAPEYIAKRIVKYRSKGGRFKLAKDLYAIYGIDSALVDLWLPYVKIRSNTVKKAKETPSLIEASKPSNISQVVNINTVDTTVLKSLPGIGSYFANAILKYRDELGGYRSLDQLLEVYLVDSVKLDNWKAHLVINGSGYSFMNINKVEIKDLVKHPYVNYKIAKAIVKYRDQHGDYLAVEDLKKSYLIDDTIFRKIAPYLTIE